MSNLSAGVRLTQAVGGEAKCSVMGIVVRDKKILLLIQGLNQRRGRSSSGRRGWTLQSQAQYSLVLPS